jgi:DTW domain-containing protein YfiP
MVSTIDRLPEVDLDIVDVIKARLSSEQGGETTITVETAAQILNLVFSPEALTKLEALLAKASAERAKAAPIQ